MNADRPQLHRLDRRSLDRQAAEARRRARSTMMSAAQQGREIARPHARRCAERKLPAEIEAGQTDRQEHQARPEILRALHPQHAVSSPGPRRSFVYSLQDYAVPKSGKRLPGGCNSWHRFVGCRPIRLSCCGAACEAERCSCTQAAGPERGNPARERPSGRPTTMTQPDTEKFRLRRFVEKLVQQGECVVHDEPIDLIDVAVGARWQSQGGVVPQCRPGEDRTGRQRHGRARAGSPPRSTPTRRSFRPCCASAWPAVQADRSAVVGGAGARGRADRRGRRSHHAAGPSPARARRRALHLGQHRLCAGRQDRFHQSRLPPHDAARAARRRHRPRRAERPARDLSGGGRARASGCRWRSRSAAIRPISSPPWPRRRRWTSSRSSARCAARRCRW